MPRNAIQILKRSLSEHLLALPENHPLKGVSVGICKAHPATLHLHYPKLAPSTDRTPLINKIPVLRRIPEKSALKYYTALEEFNNAICTACGEINKGTQKLKTTCNKALLIPLEFPFLNSVRKKAINNPHIISISFKQKQ